MTYLFIIIIDNVKGRIKHPTSKFVVNIYVFELYLF